MPRNRTTTAGYQRHRANQRDDLSSTLAAATASRRNNNLMEAIKHLVEAKKSLPRLNIRLSQKVWEGFFLQQDAFFLYPIFFENNAILNAEDDGFVLENPVHIAALSYLLTHSQFLTDIDLNYETDNEQLRNNAFQILTIALAPESRVENIYVSHITFTPAQCTILQNLAHQNESLGRMRLSPANRGLENEMSGMLAERNRGRVALH